MNTMNSATHKRKGDDFSISRNIVFSPERKPTRWDACKTDLQSIRDCKDDDLLASIQALNSRVVHFEKAVESKKELGETILSRLHVDIDKATAACQEKSAALSAMHSNVQSLRDDKVLLQRKIEECNQETTALKREIALHKNEAEVKMDEMDILQEERKRQVPRLQYQISLYAACTGIKWDYDQENLLAGHADVPSLERVRRFSFDPNEMTRFEIANALWKVIDGRTQ